jgi:hypothetical protein
MDILQIGFYTAYLVPLNNFNFVLGMGVYLKDKFRTASQLYNRIGCRYQFSNGLTSSINLKTHLARADYLEFAIGYTFNYK